jgi:hypothetical protein
MSASLSFHAGRWIPGNISNTGRVDQLDAAGFELGCVLDVQKENPMRKIATVAGLATLLCFAVAGFAKPPAATKSAAGTIVIVFKDGHRQSFNLSDIARVEFGAGAETSGETGAASALAPSRGHFLGKWEVGDGSGSSFFITLEENGDAWRSLRHAHGKWVYADGEARVTWDDGPHDAIRKVGSKYQKFAYGTGKSFTDTPDNVTDARNTNPHPI